MARLGEICGGTPGRPGDMLRGIAPRPPRPPKAPTPPKPPKPVGQKKSGSGDDQDRDHQAEHTQG
jgi:hypothetical protein